ncbi:MAG: hypothetical protein PHT51_01140 [Patescibacteria group bacterium]|nr:hypothetical protein [Patescibacteria group bacterium]MDD4610480.1 hypothetical protein [Patescibacteria group bacterium]
MALVGEDKKRMLILPLGFDYRKLYQTLKKVFFEDFKPKNKFSAVLYSLFFYPYFEFVECRKFYPSQFDRAIAILRESIEGNTGHYKNGARSVAALRIIEKPGSSPVCEISYYNI